jgi:hypothetical protein
MTETFRYELSKPVFCKKSVDGKTIKFENEDNNLKGFKIIIDNETELNATKKAKNLESILIILSGMDLEARLTGSEEC